MIYFRENSIVVTETVKRLNILRFAYHKDENRRIYKCHIFVLIQVNLKELIFIKRWLGVLLIVLAVDYFPRMH